MAIFSPVLLTAQHLDLESGVRAAQSDAPISLRLQKPDHPTLQLAGQELELALPPTEWVDLQIPPIDGEPADAPLFVPQPSLVVTLPLPEGNYRVTIETAEGAGRLVLRAESRRPMAMSDTPGKNALEAVVNVRHREIPPPPQNAPGGTEVRTNEREVGSLSWDDNLTLSLTGACHEVHKITIERVDVPKIFLAGDSTVTDMSGGDYSSWGHVLPYFFQPDVAVANHAESGETLKSFLTGLRLDKIFSLARPGDWLFIQFGHNDSKENWPQTYAAPDSTYPAYLRAYIEEARRRDLHVVLVTSMHRRRFDDAGQIVDTHGSYPPAVRRVAEEMDVPLVDLHAMSEKLYEALGPDDSVLAFANGGQDGTHHSAYGAYLLARCVVQALREQDLPLAQHLRPDIEPFDPAHPGDAGNAFISDWRDAEAGKPAGN